MKKALHWLLVAAALAYIGYQGPRLLSSVEDAASDLSRLHWGWVAASVVLGLLAVAVYALLHQELLFVGRARVPTRAVVSITYAQNAINATVPAVGAPASIAYAISRLRRCGVDSALATWVVMFAGLLDTLVLVGLAAVALAVAGLVPVPLAAVIIVSLVVGSVALWMLITHPGVMQRVLRPILWFDRFIPTGCQDCRAHRASDLDDLTRRVATRVAMLRPSPWQWTRVLGITVLSWVVDFANLIVATATAIRPVPWAALVLGFLVVQAAIAVAVIPGGAGLADLGLLGVLLGAGVAAGPAAAAVLIYRASSWLLPAVVGWINYGVQIHVMQPRRHRHRFHLRSAEHNATLDEPPGKGLAAPPPAGEGSW